MRINNKSYKIKNKFGRVSYSFNTDFVHVFDLYVYPEYRQQGHAKKLLTEAFLSIRETGYMGPIDIVAQPRENSISLDKLKDFYKSLGFQVYDYYG